MRTSPSSWSKFPVDKKFITWMKSTASTTIIAGAIVKITQKRKNEKKSCHIELLGYCGDSMWSELRSSKSTQCRKEFVNKSKSEFDILAFRLLLKRAQWKWNWKYVHELRCLSKKIEFASRLVSIQCKLLFNLKYQIVFHTDTHLTNNCVSVAGFMLMFIVACRNVFNGIREAILRVAILFVFGQFTLGRDESSWNNAWLHTDGYSQEKEDNNLLGRKEEKQKIELQNKRCDQFHGLYNK